MQINTLISLFEDITNGHPDGIRFFNGKNEDENWSEADQYPAIMLAPPNNTFSLFDGSQPTNGWDIVIACMDRYSMDISTAQKMSKAADMYVTLQEIVLKFLQFGEDEVEVTFNGVTETLSFRLSGQVNFQWVMDDGEQNLYGYVATLRITDRDNKSACDLDSIITSF